MKICNVFPIPSHEVLKLGMLVYRLISPPASSHLGATLSKTFSTTAIAINIVET
jgi:hypothetical protein